MTITETKATEPGQLDGYVWVCPQCGMPVVSSLETLVALDAESHVEWHASTGK